jgi:hypothetical protein
MHFHFCLATLPAIFRESVQDFVTLLASGLNDCGCRVTIDDAQVIYGGKTINLFIEHFEGDAVGNLIETKRQKGRDFPFGILFCENLNDTQVMSGEFAWRSESFRSVAEVSDFIWHLMPRTEQRTDIVDPEKCSLLTLGHSPGFRNIPVQPERDIDFYLPGLPYPRRKPILQNLHDLGFNVRSSDLKTPAYIFRSLMGRSKAILEIGRFDNTSTPSTVRICIGATNSIPVVAEKFKGPDFEYMYDYTVAADFDSYVERCVDLVEHGNPIATGKAIHDKFATERPFKPILEALLSNKLFDPFRD